MILLRRPFAYALLTAAMALCGCAQGPVVPPGGTASEELAPEAVKVDPAAARDMISAYRRAHGLSEVVLDPLLQNLAQAQADAMASADRLSHDVKGSPAIRLAAVHRGQAAAVENVSAGYFSLARAFAGWQKSPEHNANLLDPAMRRMGIATAYAPGTRYKVFWALDMTN